MIRAVHPVLASILGLGESPSAFGTSLALILTFVVIMGLLVNILVVYIIVQVMNERRENQERMRRQAIE
jgi:hypothetical protein